MNTYHKNTKILRYSFCAIFFSQYVVIVMFIAI